MRLNAVHTRMAGPRLKLAAAVVLLAVTAAVCASARDDSLPVEIRDWGRQAINLVYEEDFPTALEYARRIVKKFPDHPAGYFFSAAALDSWMAYQQSDSRENDFYQYCDQAVEKGENMLARRPDDAWVKFFIGGAEGLKGSYETRFERLITAFRYGWRGVSTLRELQARHPEITDIDYGVGTYDYWRSAMTKVMFWLPGVEDRRDAGIKCLYNAKTKGFFTSVPAASNLIAILNNEKRFAELLALSDEMLRPYPRCTAFRWGRAWGLFGLARYSEALKELLLIQERLNTEQGSNHFMQAVCHLWLAKTYRALKDQARCAAECDRMRGYHFSPAVRKRLDKYFNEAEALRGQSGKKPASAADVSGR